MEQVSNLSIVPDYLGRVEGAFVATLKRGAAVVTIGFTIADEQSGAGLAITTMTTLPERECGKGYGTEGIRQLIEWAKANGHKHIVAVQVQKPAERFWMKNGFEPLLNRTNDFELRREQC